MKIFKPITTQTALIWSLALMVLSFVCYASGLRFVRFEDILIGHIIAPVFLPLAFKTIGDMPTDGNDY